MNALFNVGPPIKPIATQDAGMRMRTPSIAGATFDPAQDGKRLGTQLAAVKELMADGVWRTLFEIRERVEGSETAISARLRDLRKPEFGAATVEARRRGGSGGTWEYRVVKNGN